MSCMGYTSVLLRDLPTGCVLEWKDSKTVIRGPYGEYPRALRVAVSI